MWFSRNNLTSIQEDTGLIPWPHSSGLRIWHCFKLQCRLQMWLRSGVAVAVTQAGGCNSDLTPSLGTSMCCGYGPKKTNQQTKNQCLQNIWGMEAACSHQYFFKILQVNQKYNRSTIAMASINGLCVCFNIQKPQE